MHWVAYGAVLKKNRSPDAHHVGQNALHRRPPLRLRGRPTPTKKTNRGTTFTGKFLFIRPKSGPEMVNFWGLAGPGARETLSKGGGLRPPPFGMVFEAAGAAQIPKIGDFRPAQQPCIESVGFNMVLIVFLKG